MNPLAIYEGLCKTVESSAFSGSISVEFGWEPPTTEPSTRARICVVPGDQGLSLGPSQWYAPTTNPRYVAVQHWYTTLLIEMDDSSESETDQFRATYELRNWLHSKLSQILPAGRMEILTQDYPREQERVNHIVMRMVIQTSEWIEAVEDAGLTSIFITGQVEETLLDHTEIFAAP